MARTDNKVPLTYIGLENLIGQLKSSYVVAFSEFIDNSLGSWIDKGGKKGKLVVDIDVDFANDLIKVTDNALGVEESQIARMMWIGGSSGDGFNVFNVGMKKAALWLGQDFQVVTYNGKRSFSLGLNLSEKLNSHEKNDQVTYSGPNPATKTSRGTKIVISKLRRTGRDKFNVKQICRVLGTKYANLLGDSEFPFSINMIIGSKVIEVKPEAPPQQRIDPSKIAFFKKQLEIAYQRHHTRIFDFKGAAIEAIEKGEPLFFPDCKFAIGGKHLKISFGIIEKISNFKSYHGIYTYEHNRAINFPPVHLPFARSKDYTRTDIKRAFAIVDMTGAFKTDNAKTQFNMSEEETGEWATRISDFTEDLAPLCKAVKMTVELKDTTLPKITSQAVIEKTNEFLDQSEMSSRIKATQRGAEGDLLFSLDKRNKRVISFKIVTYDKNDFKSSANLNASKPLYISDPDTKLDGVSVQINLNVSHRMWSPLWEKNDEARKRAIIYPIAGVMGVASYINRISKDDTEGELSRYLQRLTLDEIYQKVIDAIEHGGG